VNKVPKGWSRSDLPDTKKWAAPMSFDQSDFAQAWLAYAISLGCAWKGKKVPDPDNPADPRIGADRPCPGFGASVPAADLRHSHTKEEPIA
jgi:hypothetical protein